MRSCLFKVWLPNQLDESGTKVSGTGKWSEDFINAGVFHQWGVAYEGFESGPGNYSVAIVERADGTIAEVLPSHIKFIEP